MDVGLGLGDGVPRLVGQCQVLILVLVDVGLGLSTVMSLLVLGRGCLNPCFSGCWSRTFGTTFIRQIKLVLILVLVDVGLGRA